MIKIPKGAIGKATRDLKQIDEGAVYAVAGWLSKWSIVIGVEESAIILLKKVMNKSFFTPENSALLNKTRR